MILQDSESLEQWNLLDGEIGYCETLCVMKSNENPGLFQGTRAGKQFFVIGISFYYRIIKMVCEKKMTKQHLRLDM